MCDVQLQIIQQVKGSAELCFGLPGEADDDVGGYGRAGDLVAYAIDQPAVLVYRVAALHPGQYVVVPGLDRDLDVFAYLW